MTPSSRTLTAAAAVALAFVGVISPHAASATPTAACVDNANATQMLSAEGPNAFGGPISCAALAAMHACDHPTHGAKIRDHCKATCGTCPRTCAPVDATATAATNDRDTTAAIDTATADSAAAAPGDDEYIDDDEYLDDDDRAAAPGDDDDDKAASLSIQGELTCAAGTAVVTRNMRGVWKKRLAFVKRKEDPDFTLADCAALCESNTECVAYAFNVEARGIKDVICVTYKKTRHGSGAAAKLYDLYECTPVTTTVAPAPPTTAPTSSSSSSSSASTVTSSTTATTSSASTATSTATTPWSAIFTEAGEVATVLGWVQTDFAEFKGKTVKLERCYSMAESGDAGKVDGFHSACDNKGPTVTVVKTNEGFIFGGAADKGWASPGGWSGSYVASDSAFLFCVNCAGARTGAAPSQLKLTGRNNHRALYHSANAGPIFGFDLDILVNKPGPNSATGGTNTAALSSLGYTYTCPDGISAGEACGGYLAGHYEFDNTDVEIFSRGLHPGAGDIYTESPKLFIANYEVFVIVAV